MDNIHPGYNCRNNFLIIVILSLCMTVIILFLVTFDIQFNTVYASTDLDNPVLKWNTFTTTASLDRNFSPPALARAYALVHISIYDALLSSKNVDLDNILSKENEIIDGAASEVLTYLYPDMKDKINNFTSIQIIPSENTTRGPNIYNTSKSSKALQFGQSVGKQVVLYAKNDGPDSIFNGVIPKGECKWNGTNPLEPMAGQWKTLILSSGI